MPIHPLNSIPIPPEPNDPVPVHDPKPRPRPLPDPPPDDEPIKLSHRERRSATIRASRLSAPKCNARNNCDRFSTLNVLPAAQLTNLNELGYLSMTPVQAAALPAILAGKDVRVQAKPAAVKRRHSASGCSSTLTPRCSRRSRWCCVRPANWRIRSPVSCVARALSGKY